MYSYLECIYHPLTLSQAAESVNSFIFFFFFVNTSFHPMDKSTRTKTRRFWHTRAQQRTTLANFFWIFQQSSRSRGWLDACDAGSAEAKIIKFAQYTGSVKSLQTNPDKLPRLNRGGAGPGQSIAVAKQWKRSRNFQTAAGKLLTSKVSPRGHRNR